MQDKEKPVKEILEEEYHLGEEYYKELLKQAKKENDKYN